MTSTAPHTHSAKSMDIFSRHGADGAVVIVPGVRCTAIYSKRSLSRGSILYVRCFGLMCRCFPVRPLFSLCCNGFVADVLLVLRHGDQHLVLFSTLKVHHETEGTVLLEFFDLVHCSSTACRYRALVYIHVGERGLHVR